MRSCFLATWRNLFHIEPLTCCRGSKDDRFTLAGVASFVTESNNTCAAGTKIGFVRISAVLEWIVKSIKNMDEGGSTIVP